MKKPVIINQPIMFQIENKSDVVHENVTIKGMGIGFFDTRIEPFCYWDNTGSLVVRENLIVSSVLEGISFYQILSGLMVKPFLTKSINFHANHDIPDTFNIKLETTDYFGCSVMLILEGGSTQRFQKSFMNMELTPRQIDGFTQITLNKIQPKSCLKIWLLDHYWVQPD